jgi:drug/metabolite transporter (DMT)-like permease
MMNEAARFQWSTVMLLIGTLLLLSLGQILFKLSAAGLSLKDPRSLLSPSLFTALAVYTFATAMWIAVLKRLPLSVAFPFYGLTFILVPLLAYVFLGEKLSYQTLLGGAIILIGIFVTSWGITG